jgi:hypothetical protein
VGVQSVDCLLAKVFELANHLAAPSRKIDVLSIHLNLDHRLKLRKDILRLEGQQVIDLLLEILVSVTNK